MAQIRVRANGDGVLPTPGDEDRAAASGAGFSRSYKNYAIGLLLAAYICSYVDRQVFALLMEPIRQELHLSDSQMGFLSGPAFVVFYALLSIPIARLADVGSRVNIIATAAALWSGMTILCGAASSFWTMLLARVGVGIGEAGCTPPAQSIIVDYVSRTERTRALSRYMLGIPLGVLAGYLLGGWINQGYGWRIAFMIVGLPGLVLAVLIKWTLREPPRAHSQATSTATGQPSLGAVFLTLWRRAGLRHLVLAMTLLGAIRAGTLTWLPTFFIRTHGMTTGELGTWLALVSGGGGALGTWLGGHLATRYGAQDEGIQVRLLCLSAVLSVPLLIAALLYPTRYGALLLLIPAEILLYSCNGPYFALVQTLCEAKMRATMTAVVMLIQLLLGGTVGIQVLGFLSDLGAPLVGPRALQWAMVATSPLLLWSAVHFWLAARSVREDAVAAGGYTK